MDFDTCVHKRRSCRYYKKKNVPPELIGELLDCGIYAPSAANLQNWSFIIVTDEEKRAKISQLCIKQTWMVDAPVHIVICNDKRQMKKMFPKRGELYSIQGCSMVAQNILLKTEELGLGSCLVGSFDDDAIQRLLKIPAHIIPEIIITVGYADKFEKPSPRTQVNYITYFNEYGNKRRDDTLFPLNKYTKKADLTVEKEGKKLFDKLKKAFRG